MSSTCPSVKELDERVFGPRAVVGVGRRPRLVLVADELGPVHLLLLEVERAPLDGAVPRMW